MMNHDDICTYLLIFSSCCIILIVPKYKSSKARKFKSTKVQKVRSRVQTLKFAKGYKIKYHDLTVTLNMDGKTPPMGVGESSMAVQKYWKISQVDMVITWKYWIYHEWVPGDIFFNTLWQPLRIYIPQI